MPTNVQGRIIECAYSRTDEELANNLYTLSKLLCEQNCKCIVSAFSYAKKELLRDVERDVSSLAYCLDRINNPFVSIFHQRTRHSHISIVATPEQQLADIKEFNPLPGFSRAVDMAVRIITQRSNDNPEYEAVQSIIYNREEELRRVYESAIKSVEPLVIEWKFSNHHASNSRSEGIFTR